jgi:tetratricopeptide (TPR) repeat protein
MFGLLAGAFLAGESRSQEPSKASETVQTEPTAPRAMADGLPLQHRRYLLYLYARLGKPKIAEQLAQKILQESPGDKQTYLVLASMYLERREAEKALRNGKALADLYPTEDQAWYFLGAAHQQAGHYEEANRIFRKLKEAQFEGRLYPYESDLAASALGAGDWYRAMQAYQELLREHALSEELRQQTRTVLEGIYREHLPQLNLQGEVLWLGEGMIYRTLVEYQQHLSTSQTIFTRLTHESTEVDGGLSLISRSNANFDGVAGLESTFSRKYSTRAWLGGSESGPIGGASFTRSFGPQREISFAFLGNERTQDGLLIESLDGRQHRFNLDGTYLINRKWLLYSQVFAREVHLPDESLGEGIGGNFNVEHIFLHEKPGFRGGYRAYVSTFSERKGLAPELVSEAVEMPVSGGVDVRAAAVEGLVLDYLHREGLYLRYEDRLSDFFHYYGTIGSDYAVESSSLEYYWQAGFRVYPRKSIELRLDGGYYSSATTSAQASEQWQLIAGLKFWF